MTTMTTAFVLSGGGARAAAQVGILQAFMDREIVPDMVVGSSAGAVNGGWYALHPDNLDDLINVWLSLKRRRVFPGSPPRSAYNFVRHGHIHSMSGWERVLRNSFGSARIEDAQVPLTVVAVRLSDGAAVPFSSGPLTPILKATTAVPGLFPPQVVDGELYVDGAVVEFLPVPTAIRLGASTIYALDCSDLPPGDGSHGMTIDRTGQIGARGYVKMVTELARIRGCQVYHFRPSLGELYDGRDFRQTMRLMDVGYEHACHVLDDIATRATSA